jgi:hypothetical protein
VVDAALLARRMRQNSLCGGWVKTCARRRSQEAKTWWVWRGGQTTCRARNQRNLLANVRPAARYLRKEVTERLGSVVCRVLQRLHIDRQSYSCISVGEVATSASAGILDILNETSVSAVAHRTAFLPSNRQQPFLSKSYFLSVMIFQWLSISYHLRNCNNVVK